MNNDRPWGVGGDLPALCAIEEYSSDRMERTKSQKSPSMHVRGAELIAARELEIRIAGGRAVHVNLNGLNFV